MVVEETVTVCASKVVTDLVAALCQGFEELEGVLITHLSSTILKRHAWPFVVHAIVCSGKVTCRTTTPGVMVVDCASLVEEHQRCRGAWQIAEHLRHCVTEYIKGATAGEIFNPLLENRITMDTEVVLHSGKESNFTERHAEHFLLHALYTASNQAYSRLRVLDHRKQSRRTPRPLKSIDNTTDIIRGPMPKYICPADKVKEQQIIRDCIIHSQDVVSLVKESLVNPVTFQDPGMVHLDPGLDFGMHVLGGEQGGPVREDGGSMSLLEMQEHVHLASGRALRRGTVTITQSPNFRGKMWLCGGVAYPRLDGRFLFCDPCNLFFHEYSMPRLLENGVSHPVDVVMSTEDCGNSFGILHQDCVMLFCCPYNPKRNVLRDTGVSYRTMMIGTKKYRMFCLGFKVSAIILKKKDLDMYQSPMNIKARPFYSKNVESVFETKPAYLHASYEEEILDSLMVDRSLLPLCSHDALEKDRVRYFDIPVDKPRVVRFAKLIQIEAMQQMIDIKGHDMHFCRVSVARFQGRNPRTYTILGEEKQQFYRGFLTHRQASNRSLLVIKVPSIIEGHPAIYLGTLVHLRLVKNPTAEYNLICCGIDRDDVFLLPPMDMFYGNTSSQETLQSIFNDQGKDGRSESNLCSIRFGCSTASLRTMLNPLMDDSVVQYIPDDDEHLNDSNMMPSKKQVRDLAMKITAGSMLNIEQSSAIALLLLGGGRTSPVTLLGPPGTGKTSTLTQCVVEIFKMYSESKILCCAPVNFSADVIISELRKKGVPSECMLRLNDPRRPVYSVKDDIIDCCIIEESTGIFKIPTAVEIGRYQIVVCTCIASEFLPKQLFTHVLIDEAGQAIIPETLLPLQSLISPSNDVTNTSWGSWLCGDPKQLGPIVRNSIASNCGLSTSLLQLLVEKRPSHNCNLRQNYRSNDDILRLPSNMFYSSSLVYSGEGECVVPPSVQWEEGLDESQVPLIFYGVNGEHARQGESQSYSNKMEAAVCVRLIKNLVDKEKVVADDIGVLALYRRQVYLIRTLLREHGLKNVRVGTLDDYQGQEEKVVFISTVISDMNDMGPMAKEFFQNPNRFNVAITRAKSLLVVLGHPAVISLDSVWKQYLREAMKVGGLFGCYHNFLDFEIENENSSDDASIISAFRNIAILGPGTMEYPTIDLDPFDEDTPWRILL